MAFPAAFLDEVRSRTVLSALIGRSVKLAKAGREFKGCCPVHSEKTPSFTVNDEKGFGHCFGCGYHADAFRWMQDHGGLSFVDAVKELAASAGLELPAFTPEQAQREARIGTLREALETAQAAFVEQLPPAGAVMEYLAARGIGPAEIEAFGIGYARGGDGTLKGRGIGAKLGEAAGLLARREDGSIRETFFDRITIPIHDARGRLCGFGGRVWPGRRGDTPKFLNSPDTPIFDKGRLLFNLARAARAARPVPVGPTGSASGSASRPLLEGDEREGRLIVVEGYFDVIALWSVGIKAAVAPMGTALTEAQLTRLWRVHHRPVLLFDGDEAGRRAALRAAKLALPHAGPGHELAVALLPEGKDPDDVVRSAEGGRAAIETAIAVARPLHEFLFDAAMAIQENLASPEATAGKWAALEAMAREIADPETRAQYLAVWWERYEREVSVVRPTTPQEPLHALIRADDGNYAWPEAENDSARRLIAIVQALLGKRAERRAIGDEIKDLMTMAKAIGFDGRAITATLRDIESDLTHGSAVRETDEMHRVLYRRVLGVRGPLNEAMMPQLIDARSGQTSAGAKRRAARDALIDARAVEV